MSNCDNDQQNVSNWLAKRLAEILDKPTEAFTPATRLEDTGLDSISESGLAVELEQAFSTRVTPDVLIANPTIGELANYIASATNDGSV